MKRQRKIIILLALVMLTLSAVFTIAHIRQHNRQMAVEKERDRVRKLIDRYFPKWANVSEKRSSELRCLYAEASKAYEKRDPSAVCDLLTRINVILLNLQGAVSSDFDAPLQAKFNEEFYFAAQLGDFSDCGELERFLRVNCEVAMHLGEGDACRKSVDILLGRDCLTYKCLKDYRDKFREKKQPELERIAEKYLAEWAARIESTNGFTRVAIREDIRLNSEYAEARWPGRGWSKEDCCRAARARARGLIKVGYTPKWLDADYPDPDAEKKPVARPSP